MQVSMLASLALILDSEWDRYLQKLRNQPSLNGIESFARWYQKNGKAWIDKIKALGIECISNEYDWQFNDDQKQLLMQYYDANKLLAECLYSGCKVNNSIQQQIEETLLLPIAEIEKRKREKAE